ncbi:MAG: PAS domain-containing protein, partial [Candidatus Hydrothermarchaeales archaeon]
MKNTGEVIQQTKEELEKILNTIQEGICVIDKDLIIRNFNDAFAKNIRLPRGKIIGKKCYEVLHGYSDKDYQKHCVERCIVNQAFEKKKPVKSVHKHVQRIGPPIYHESKALPPKDGDQVVYIINDITKRKLLEKEIKESEEKYRGLVNNSVVGVYQTNMDGKILTSNPKLVKIFGFRSEKEFKRARPENLYKDNKRREELLKILEEKGEVSNFELEARRKDGKTIILNISAKVYGNHGEKSRYIEGIIQDVTEQNR